MANWTPVSEIPRIVEGVKAAFKTEKTRPIEWRKNQLKQLWRMIDENEEIIREAVFLDLGKVKAEAQLMEIGPSKAELRCVLNGMDSWLAPEAVDAPQPYPMFQPTIYKQPKGTMLIISAFNYPFQVFINGLVGAIACGNTAILHPSEITSNTEKLLVDLLPRYIDSDCYRIVTGDKNVVAELLKHPFDHILFTGSGRVGKIVMAAAAKHLTPVTLELGGKNPVIVSEKANVKLAAKRVLWGKYAAAGQTCIAPDYALVHESVAQDFVEALTNDINNTYGTNAQANMATVVINKSYKANFERLSSLLKETKGTIIGSPIDPTSTFIQPTIVTNLSRSDILFDSEIFGPILPILTYKTLTEVPDTIESIDGTPLALYLMTEDLEEMSWIRDNTLSGGVAFNDIMAQAAVTGMPFGGVGQSGFGSFHGRASIDAFSHRKSVVTVPTVEGFEAMMEMRYVDGDLEAKYQIMKQLEQLLE